MKNFLCMLSVFVLASSFVFASPSSEKSDEEDVLSGASATNSDTIPVGRAVRNVDSATDSFVVSTPVVVGGEGLEFYFRYASENRGINFVVTLDHGMYHDKPSLSFFANSPLSVQYMFADAIIPVAYAEESSDGKFSQATVTLDIFADVNFTDLALVSFPYVTDAGTESIDITISPETAQQLQSDFEDIIQSPK